MNDVLDLERMDAGEFQNSPKPFPLHRAINAMLGNVRIATKAKNLDLAIYLDGRIDQFATKDMPEGLWVMGDEIRLRQILTNLASNAVSGQVALVYDRTI